MNPEIKAQWVQALREGKLADGTPIEQGRNALQTRDGKFCCLGVLCEIAVRAGVIEPPTRIWGGEWLYDGEENWPPESVKKWADVALSEPLVQTPDGSQAGLGSLNDGHQCPSDSGCNINKPPLTFVQIADLIEASL